MSSNFERFVNYIDNKIDKDRISSFVKTKKENSAILEKTFDFLDKKDRERLFSGESININKLSNDDLEKIKKSRFAKSIFFSIRNE